MKKKKEEKNEGEVEERMEKRGIRTRKEFVHEKRTTVMTSRI